MRNVITTLNNITKIASLFLRCGSFGSKIKLPFFGKSPFVEREICIYNFIGNTMELEVFEILERFENITSKNERVAYLREQSIPALKDVVRGCFDESLEFVLPAGTPPYTPNRPESTPSSLRKLHRQFGDYVRGARSAGIAQFKIERKFVQLLESIHPSDALLVLKMINKEQPAKYLTRNLAIEVWPGLIKK